MKWLYNLLGVLIGIELGLAIAVSASVYVWQRDTFVIERAVYVAFPVGMLLGIVSGLKAADRVWRRVRDDLFCTPGRTKATYFFCLAVAVVGVNIVCAHFFTSTFEPPADRELIANFERNRATLDRIVTMIQADKGIRTDDDGTWIPFKGAEPGDKPKTRPPYRQLLPLAGVERGVRLASDGRGIKLCYWMPGEFISDTMRKGYLYSETPPAPLVTMLNDKTKGIRYRHITGNWYLYREECPY